MDLFLKAVRNKLRFNSSKGNISTEDLFSLNQKQLNDLYISLEEKTTKSVGLMTTSTNEILDLKLAVVRTVFNIKTAEANAKKAALANKAQKDRILELIAEKQDSSLKEKSLEELTAMVNAL